MIWLYLSNRLNELTTSHEISSDSLHHYMIWPIYNKSHLVTSSLIRMCDFSPRLVNSTFGNYWARSCTKQITVVLFFFTGRWTEKLFRGWKVFSGCLVAVATLLSGREGTNYLACQFFVFAFFFGPTAFYTSVPWLCECLSHLGWPWECFNSPATPFRTILDEYALQDGWHRCRSCARGCDEADGSRKGSIHLAEHTDQEWCERKYQVTFGTHMAITSVTAPRLHHHMQSQGALSQPNPQPSAAGPQQYVWMSERKLFAGWKVFSARLQRSVATAKRQSRETFQRLNFFSWLLGRSCDALIRLRREKNPLKQLICLLVWLVVSGSLHISNSFVSQSGWWCPTLRMFPINLSPLIAIHLSAIVTGGVWLSACFQLICLPLQQFICLPVWLVVSGSPDDSNWAIHLSASLAGGVQRSECLQFICVPL